jgi:hypothetical protein
MLEDGQGLVVGQPGVLKDGAFAFREGTLASAAVDQSDASALAAVTAEVKVFAAPNTRLGTGRILTAKVFDGDHASHPWS